MSVHTSDRIKRNKIQQTRSYYQTKRTEYILLLHKKSEKVEVNNKRLIKAEPGL